MDEFARAIAVFDKDRLDECLEIRAARPKVPAEDAGVSSSDGGVTAPFVPLSAREVVDMLLDEIEDDGGKKKTIFHTLAQEADGTPAGPKFSKMVLQIDQVLLKDPVKAADFRRRLQWPPKWLAEKLREGKRQVFETCAVPNRVAVGACVWADDSPTLTWRATRFYYTSTTRADSDRALKRCGQNAGKWSEVDEAVLRRQRIQQSADALQDMAKQLER